MPSPSKKYKWELLTILWVAYFLNQGDRQIFNAIMPLIKADLGLTDMQLGSVATVFTLLYGVFVLIAGCMGDFVSKKWIVCLSLLTFSVGTLFTGLSTSLFLLILFRSVATGVGEAFYYPSANSLIGQYHHSTRAQAMAVHQSSLYIGIVVSSWLAGKIGELYGWRSAFYLFGGCGILMAIVVALRLRDERKDFAPQQPVEVSTEPPMKLKEVLLSVLRTPTLYYLSGAFGAMVFATVAYMTWMPTFLHENFGLSVSDSALHSMLLHFIFAFIGVMVGGRISDRLAARRFTIRMEMGYIGLLLGAPFIWMLGSSSSLTMIYVALAGFGFFRGVYDSNLFAALFDVIPPRYRSSATGLMLACAFIVGASSPTLLGYLKDKGLDLGLGISSMAFVYLLGGILIFIATKTCFKRDYISESTTAAEA